MCFSRSPLATTTYSYVSRPVTTLCVCLTASASHFCCACKSSTLWAALVAEARIKFVQGVVAPPKNQLHIWHFKWKDQGEEEQPRMGQIWSSEIRECCQGMLEVQTKWKPTPNPERKKAKGQGQERCSGKEPRANSPVQHVRQEPRGEERAVESSHLQWGLLLHQKLHLSTAVPGKEREETGEADLSERQENECLIWISKLQRSNP